MAQPTESQRRVLRFLADRETAGDRPTYREIAEAQGWRSVGTARTHVAALAERGLVTLSGGRARGLTVTPAGHAALTGRARGEGAGDRGTPRALAPGSPDEPAPGEDLGAALTPFMEPRHLSEGTLLWTQGEPGRLAVLLESGRVRTVRTHASGRRVPYYDFHAGDLFGLLPLVDQGPYPADAEVIEPGTARVMSPEGLARALVSGPEIPRLLLGSLGRRLRQALERVSDLSEHDASPRVARALLRLLPGDAAGRGTMILQLPGRAASLAEDLGLSPPTLSRTLTRLERRGILHRLGGGRLQILDLASLKRVAGPPGW